MSSTKDPKSERECWMCGAPVKPFESVMMCTNLNCCNWRKPTYSDTPQATKPVDELRAEILTEFKQVHKLAPADYTENCTNVVMSIIERHTQALLTEARIAEWELLLQAKITHGGNPAPFNPDGLPISTPATEELTQLVHQLATTRIAQLKNERSNK